MGGSIVRGYRRAWRRVWAAAAGTALAAWPTLLRAQEEGGRTIERPEDALPVALLTAAGLLGLLLLAAIGFLYRRRRELDWDFQRPEPAHDEHH
ncbi:MAG: LPXTG cell wall anchor domain-containing protein [Chloroflexi bacterium]|nr:LPXTG cell wall anchor domain-containing protein [Chloroflexota bacterium]